MRKTYWIAPPETPIDTPPELACLDQSQVAYYTEAGYTLTRDDYCKYLDGTLRAVRGQAIPQPSPEEARRRRRERSRS